MLSLHLPINSASFGQVSTCLIRELLARDHQFRLNNIGANSLSSQKDETELKAYLESLNSKFLQEHDRRDPIFRLWHLIGSLESFSEKQFLLSFYELDAPTKLELNVVKNNHKVYFTCQETVDLFKNFGCENVSFLPLGFDKWSFFETGKKYFNDGRITFNLTGKLENRKHHAKIIKAWIKKFGNNSRYALQCAIYNPFFKPEDNSALIKNIINNERFFNVTFMGFMQKNALYNDFLNSGDIVLAMSGGEGWGLPEFQSVCLGKHAVVLHASGYKGWANKENSCLVYPSGKVSSVDNVFFKNGDPINQGNIYDFNEDEFISACEEAIKKVEANRINEAGRRLKEEFDYSKVVDRILEEVK